MSAQGQRGAHDVQFGFVASAADAPGTSDAELYRTVLEDVEWHAELGYSTAWFIEHHFSDYFPTPSPVVLMSHVAARFPQLELGTCVLVLPWYDPLRLAGEIAMLSLLTERPLHFGIGRGTAKYEFDAFGLDMGASRQHFAEAYEVIERRAVLLRRRAREGAAGGRRAPPRRGRDDGPDQLLRGHRESGHGIGHG